MGQGVERLAAQVELPGRRPGIQGRSHSTPHPRRATLRARSPRTSRCSGRISASSAGVVELPLHLGRSGMSRYDLGKPRQRMGLYPHRPARGPAQRPAPVPQPGPAPPAVAGAAHPPSAAPRAPYGRTPSPNSPPPPGQPRDRHDGAAHAAPEDVIALGSPYPLDLTGGYAVRAHRLVSRPSQDLDMAAEKPGARGRHRRHSPRRPGARGWQAHA